MEDKKTTKNQFLEHINSNSMAWSIYTENVDTIGKYSLLWQVGKEKILSKYRTLKTLCYQQTEPNDENIYPTIEIVIEKKQTKKQTSFKAIDVINY